MAFSDRAGLIEHGETVATPPAKAVAEQHGLVLLQSLSGHDYYVVVNWLEADQASNYAVYEMIRITGLGDV